MEANETLRNVIKARQEGWTWEEIGQVLCMSGPKAEYVYGQAVADHQPQYSTHVFNLS